MKSLLIGAVIALSTIGIIGIFILSVRISKSVFGIYNLQYRIEKLEQLQTIPVHDTVYISIDTAKSQIK